MYIFGGFASSEFPEFQFRLEVDDCNAAPRGKREESGNEKGGGKRTKRNGKERPQKLQRTEYDTKCRNCNGTKNDRACHLSLRPEQRTRTRVALSCCQQLFPSFSLFVIAPVWNLFSVVVAIATLACAIAPSRRGNEETAKENSPNAGRQIGKNAATASWRVSLRGRIATKHLTSFLLSKNRKPFETRTQQTTVAPGSSGRLAG